MRTGIATVPLDTGRCPRWLFVKRDVYDKLLDIMEKGIKKNKVSNREKVEAQQRLIKTLK